jgi:hypothetical protein
VIRDEAEKLARLLTERFALQAPGVLAEVEAISNRIEFAAPGGGRPTLVRYRIRIRDETRVGHLGLDEAQGLLDALDTPSAPNAPDIPDVLEAGWGPDRVFEEVAARGGAVDLAEQ